MKFIGMAALVAQIDGLKIHQKWVEEEADMIADNTEVETWANREINKANGFDRQFNKKYLDVLELSEKESKKNKNSLKIQGFEDGEYEPEQEAQVRFIHPASFVQTEFAEGTTVLDKDPVSVGTAMAQVKAKENDVPIGNLPLNSNPWEWQSAYNFPEVIRPKDLTGWSSTRGLYAGVDVIQHGDYNHEFGQNAHVMSQDNHNLIDDVRRLPGDKQSPNMEELTSSWMNDQNVEAVGDRLKSLDEEAWAGSAHQASRSSYREVLSDIISDETDALNTEKRYEAEFHPDVVVNVGSPGDQYSKENMDQLVQQGKAEKITNDKYMLFKDKK